MTKPKPREWIVTLLPHGVEPPAGAEVSTLADCHHGRWRAAIAAVPVPAPAPVKPVQEAML